MSSASSLTWPSSRVLAGWWPLLGRCQPRFLWLHGLLLHRIETLVSISRGPALDRLEQLLLESLTASTAGVLLGQLALRLGLEPALLGRFLAELEAAGLTRHDSASARWTLTEGGRDALAGHRDLASVRERRSFCFTVGTTRHPGARFLPLENDDAAAWPEGETVSFDMRVLSECLARPPDWKQAAGFPLDVRGLVEASSGWEGVTIHRPQQLFLLAVLTGQGHLLGFGVQAGTWQIQVDRPLLRLGESWRELLPELTEEPDLEQWREAWRNWGQPRNLPPGEVEACHLERVDSRLRIRAPRPLVERLRSTRSDAIKGEAWLLASTQERTRSAAAIELLED